MKRSRTCQCLHELDLPKRSRSTPDLGALKRAKEVFGGENFSHNLVLSPRNMEGSMQLSNPVAQNSGFRPTMAMASGGRIPVAEDFVVDSIVRSKGSLNEITILEHEEFIGDESPEIGVGMDLRKSTALFDRDELGDLFDDSEDSSDYFCGVDSDEAEEDSTSRSADAESNEGADEAMVKKAKHGGETGGVYPEDDALRTEWRTHDRAAQLEAARPWCKTRSYGSMLSRGPTIGREDPELRLARPIPENGSTNGPRTARAFSPVPGRTKQPDTASSPLSGGVPQERRRDAAPAAPPPQSSDALRSPASASKLSTSADVGNVPTSRLVGNLVSLPFLSVSAPCLNDVDAYGYPVATNQDHVLEGTIGTHRHRVRLVTGHDMMSLLSLERLSLDARPSGLKMSPDPMWHYRPAPLVVAAKASMDGCGQSSL